MTTRSEKSRMLFVADKLARLIAESSDSNSDLMKNLGFVCLHLYQATDAYANEENDEDGDDGFASHEDFVRYEMKRHAEKD